MAAKGSAVTDEPIEVLIALHNKFNLMDFAGPMEVLDAAQHDMKDESTKAFEITLAGDEEKVMSSQGVIVNSQITFKEAHESIKDYDILIIVGGNTKEILDTGAEPLDLINAFTAVQEDDPSRERTLFSVCTGSLFLAKQGILEGVSATTHPDYMIQFENLCSQAAQKDLDERTDVIENERYVVNNPRFDVDNVDESPYVRRRSDANRRPSTARKGSISFKGSTRRESITRREEMRLGGLRLITAGGVTAGIDATLYLVSAMVSNDVAEEIARLMQHNWVKGTVINGVDV